jgi:hypothetical protein
VTAAPWFLLRLAVASLVCSSWTEVAFAQACHAGPPLEALGLGLHVSTSLEFAAYDNARGEGHWVGVALGAAYRRDFLRLRAQMPFYRLERNDETSTGPGDLIVGAEAALLRDEDRFAAGIGVAVSVPTGNASDDLGMGHFMLMPGLWGELTRDRTFVQAQVAYGRALASRDDHAAHEHAGHHGSEQAVMGPGPIVSPMNFSEIEGRLSGGYRIVELVRLRAGVDAAVPVADEQGESRAIAVVGVDFLPDPWNLALEGQLPFIGDPFSAKVSASAGFRF